MTKYETNKKLGYNSQDHVTFSEIKKYFVEPQEASNAITFNARETTHSMGYETADIGKTGKTTDLYVNRKFLAGLIEKNISEDSLKGISKQDFIKKVETRPNPIIGKNGKDIKRAQSMHAKYYEQKNQELTDVGNKSAFNNVEALLGGVSDAAEDKQDNKKGIDSLITFFNVKILKLKAGIEK